MKNQYLWILFFVLSRFITHKNVKENNLRIYIRVWARVSLWRLYAKKMSHYVGYMIKYVTMSFFLPKEEIKNPRQPRGYCANDRGIYKRGKWWWQINGLKSPSYVIRRNNSVGELFTFEGVCLRLWVACFILPYFGSAEVVMITGIVDESGNYESDELKHLCVTSVTWISSRSFPINTRIILPREKKFYT